MAWNGSRLVLGLQARLFSERTREVLSINDDSGSLSWTISPQPIVFGALLSRPIGPDVLSVELCNLPERRLARKSIG
jgi:hypothetical protein